MGAFLAFSIAHLPASGGASGGGCVEGWIDVGAAGAESYAFATFQGELIAGGAFTEIGSASVSRVAQWNEGSPWTALGAGVTGSPPVRVHALTVYNNELIAAGTFTTAGGTAASKIARWNGSTWQTLGTGMGATNPTVYALTIYNGELIAGGQFTTAGGTSVSSIARWNGSTWQALGSGVGGTISSRVQALTVYNGELIAGGSFITAGGAPANNIARWNGTTWQPLGSAVSGGGVAGGVFCLTTYNGDLIAGGVFNSVNGQTINNLARWNGTSWQAIGEPNSAVEKVTTFNGDLIAGGSFTQIAGMPALRIASFDGGAWEQLGGGVTGGYVSGLGTFGDKLFVAGTFNMAGGNNALHMVAWRGCNAPACTGDLVDSGTFTPPPDGTVDGADLAFLLGEWGASPGSLADIVDAGTFMPPPDGVVDGADLAVLLGAWGACE